jgi:hypothetical protein
MGSLFLASLIAFLREQPRQPASVLSIRHSAIRSVKVLIQPAGFQFHPVKNSERLNKTGHDKNFIKYTPINNCC